MFPSQHQKKNVVFVPFLFCEASLKQKLQHRTNCVYREEDWSLGEHLRALNEKRDNKMDCFYNFKTQYFHKNQKSSVLNWLLNYWTSLG